MKQVAPLSPKPRILQVAERPQHLLMRVAIGIHGEDIDAAIETYNLMSERYFTHASPTLFNAGTKWWVLPQLGKKSDHGSSFELPPHFFR